VSRRGYRRPEAIREESLLWLEISEYPDKPKVLVRAYRRRSNGRWEVEFFDDGTLVIVPGERLYEEWDGIGFMPGAGTPFPAPIENKAVHNAGPEEIGPEKGKESENGEEG